MGHNSYINLPKSARDQFVYRIVSLKPLIELFRSKQNVLVKPKMWDDPFENLRARVAHTFAGEFFLQDFCYGQCWTLQKASDAMWRIYSPNSKAVRIRSTIRKLAESLSPCCGSKGEPFIGKVQYLTTPKLLTHRERSCRSYARTPSMRVLAETLLVKRPAFKHEREVRLLLMSHDKAKTESDLFAYAVDPNALIDQIMIDPRMDENKANVLRKRIKRETDFSGKIMRSLLYAPLPTLIIPG